MSPVMVAPLIALAVLLTLSPSEPRVRVAATARVEALALADALQRGARVLWSQRGLATSRPGER